MMFIVWTESDGGRYFYDEEEAKQYARETGGRLELVKSVQPDRWWITK